MRRRLRRGTAALAVAWIVAGCTAEPSPTGGIPSPSGEPTPTATSTLSASPEASVTPSTTVDATATPEPEPSIGLELPPLADGLTVSVAVEPQVGADGGRIVVTVTSQIEERIDELVVRWPRELNRTLFLRPFTPSDERLRPGAPLVQPWTKWVLGPGEEGEPEGTVSLGYGPLLPGATLTIPIDVVRRADGPVAFDLQVLAENGLLSLPDGEPAELRVEVP